MNEQYLKDKESIILRIIKHYWNRNNISESEYNLISEKLDSLLTSPTYFSIWSHKRYNKVLIKKNTFEDLKFKLFSNPEIGKLTVIYFDEHFDLIEIRYKA